MGGKPKAENSKKVAGNARKAEAAAGKQAKADAAKAAKEDAEWAEGSKDNSKKYVSCLSHFASQERAGWVPNLWP